MLIDENEGVAGPAARAAPPPAGAVAPPPAAGLGESSGCSTGQRRCIGRALIKPWAWFETSELGVFRGAMRMLGAGVGSGTIDNGRMLGIGSDGWIGMIGRNTPLGENGCGSGVGSAFNPWPRAWAEANNTPAKMKTAGRMLKHRTQNRRTLNRRTMLAPPVFSLT